MTLTCLVSNNNDTNLNDNTNKNDTNLNDNPNKNDTNLFR